MNPYHLARVSENYLEVLQVASIHSREEGLGYFQACYYHGLGVEIMVSYVSKVGNRETNACSVG